MREQNQSSTSISETNALSNGRAIVLRPVLRSEGNGRTPQARLEEACGLAAAIDLTVAHAAVVRVNRPQPATLLGRGIVEQIAGEIEQAAEAGSPIDLVVVDHALSPVQQRNLERAFKVKVIDRTGLILEIFGARARTSEGQMQVELAALSYQRSRLVRSWTHLERQRGGFGFLGGPGESQMEIDRRLIDARIERLKKQLGAVRRTRGLHRKAREKAARPVVALVGYTNAGKSTLFNRLSGAEVFAKDLLFATLDPTMRAIELSGRGAVILSDTVGFISELPTHLVAAFRATLEEVQAADVILHVRDIAHPDSEAQKVDVAAILRDLGIEPETDPRLIEVANKVDLLSAEERAAVRQYAARSDRMRVVSAESGEGMDALLECIGESLGQERELVDLEVDLANGAALAWIHDRGEVLERRDEGTSAHLRVSIDPALLARLPGQSGARFAI